MRSLQLEPPPSSELSSTSSCPESSSSSAAGCSRCGCLPQLLPSSANANNANAGRTKTTMTRHSGSAGAGAHTSPLANEAVRHNDEEAAVGEKTKALDDLQRARRHSHTGGGSGFLPRFVSKRFVRKHRAKHETTENGRAAMNVGSTRSLAFGSNGRPDGATEIQAQKRIYELKREAQVPERPATTSRLHAKDKDTRSLERSPPPPRRRAHVLQTLALAAAHVSSDFVASVSPQGGGGSGDDALSLSSTSSSADVNCHSFAGAAPPGFRSRLGAIGYRSFRRAQHLFASLRRGRSAAVLSKDRCGGPHSNNALTCDCHCHSAIARPPAVNLIDDSPFEPFAQTPAMTRAESAGDSRALLLQSAPGALRSLPAPAICPSPCSPHRYTEHCTAHNAAIISLSISTTSSS